MENAASDAVPTQDERTMAVLAHALQLVGWFIAPLIIFLLKRDSKFVSFHAVQALLLQICCIVVWMGIMAVWFVVFFGTIFTHMGPPPSNQPPGSDIYVLSVVVVGDDGNVGADVGRLNCLQR